MFAREHCVVLADWYGKSVYTRLYSSLSKMMVALFSATAQRSPDN